MTKVSSRTGAAPCGSLQDKLSGPLSTSAEGKGGGGGAPSRTRVSNKKTESVKSVESSSFASAASRQGKNEKRDGTRFPSSSKSPRNRNRVKVAESEMDTVPSRLTSPRTKGRWEASEI